MRAVNKMRENDLRHLDLKIDGIVKALDNVSGNREAADHALANDPLTALSLGLPSCPNGSKLELSRQCWPEEAHAKQGQEDASRGRELHLPRARLDGQGRQR